MLKDKLKEYAELDLDSVFDEFYKKMLSNKDFSVYFENEEQIRSLIVRQKQFLPDSILCSVNQIKTRNYEV